MAVCHPLCHAVLGAYIPWICLISIVRRRSRRCCPCLFLPRPAPPSIRQIPVALPHSRKRREYPAAEFGRCSRSHAAGCRCFPPAQVAPPKKYFAAAFSRAAEEWRLERLLSSVPLFPSHPSPFLSENENAAACQAFRPVCVCMVS